MVAVVDPAAEFFNTKDADYQIEIRVKFDGKAVTCQGKINGLQKAEIFFHDPKLADLCFGPDEMGRLLKEIVRRGILEIISKIGWKRPPWGILTGVRPSKIYHYLRDQGYSTDEIKRKLKEHYLLSPEKVLLLTEVGEVQRPWLEPTGKKLSIYIGIPFCPTKCLYCSFASYPLETHAHLLKGFLEALYFEIEEIGKAFQKTGYSLASIYIGGGTPTVLNHLQLRTLLGHLSRNLPLVGLPEFTVEAGRPDTLDFEKLKVLKDFGVTRVSVNPQTMNPKTLEKIGRKHTPREIEEAVEMVDKVKIPCLNMDMIIGLPGEGVEDWENTLGKILSFKPKNITIHTLAPKRAASWDFSLVKNQVEEESVSRWLSQVYSRLKTKEYYPYYLYRQRRIIAGQENVGYTLKGWEGIYNIQMMEERSTVLGLGGGGMTKWYNPLTHKVERSPNPKCPATYQGRIKELVEEKVNKLLWSVD